MDNFDRASLNGFVSLISPVARDAQILVVGGSLAGPVAGLTLRSAGFEKVTVVDRRTPGQPNASGVIAVDDVAVMRLDGLGVDVTSAAPFSTYNHVVHNVHSSGRIDRDRRRVPVTRFDWKSLNDQLIGLLGESAKLGREVTSLFVQVEDRRAALKFADGSTIAADIVIFADGKGSFGRALFNPTRQAQYNGSITWRGRVMNSRHLDGIPDSASWVDDDTWLVVNQAHINGASVCEWALMKATDPIRAAELLGDAYEQPFTANVGSAVRSVVAEYAEKLSPDMAAAIRETEQVHAVPSLVAPTPTRMFHPVGNSLAILIGDALHPLHHASAEAFRNALMQIDVLVDVFELGDIWSMEQRVLSGLAGADGETTDLLERTGMATVR